MNHVETSLGCALTRVYSCDTSSTVRIVDRSLIPKSFFVPICNHPSFLSLSPRKHSSALYYYILACFLDFYKLESYSTFFFWSGFFQYDYFEVHPIIIHISSSLPLSDFQYVHRVVQPWVLPNSKTSSSPQEFLYPLAVCHSSFPLSWNSWKPLISFLSRLFILKYVF